MVPNTLVYHKKLKSLGIGCISKVLLKSVLVNFGLTDVKRCTPNSLDVIDVSASRTVNFIDFKNRILKDDDELNFAIVGNELKQYIGIGWLTLRVITDEDLKKYPRVI